MQGCKISVVIPVYNMKDTIARSIESVIAQDYKNKELLVLDGGSTDGTTDVIEKYLDYIDFYVSKRDGGSSAAIAGNMNNITGDYVSVLGADDWYEEGALSAMAHTWEHNKADAYYGDYYEHLDDGQVLRKSASMVDLDMTYYQCPFNTNAAFVAYDALDMYYSNYWIDHKEELTMASDHFLWLVMYHNKYRFAYIPSQRPIVNFSMTGRSNMNMKQLCEQNRHVMDYVLPQNDETYPRRAAICDLYCNTRMLNYYSDSIDRASFIEILDKHIHKDEKYYIFGVGHMGQEAYKLLSVYDVAPQYFVDTYANTANGEYCNIKIYKPTILKSETQGTIIIASVGYEDEMEKQLLAMELNSKLNIIKFTELCSRILKDCEGLTIND